MNLTDRQLDILDRFLRNEMGDSDREEWKAMMQDPRVQDEIRNMTHLQQAIREEGRERLRAELGAWDMEEGKAAEKPGAKRVFSYWRWAAAAVLFLIVVAALLMQNRDSDPASLFAEYYAPYPNIVAPIQKGESSVDPFSRAFQLYEAGQYQEAIDAFELLPKNNPSIIFYMGLCQVELGEDEEARYTFATLHMIPDHPYHQAVEWYLALLELRSGSLEKAILMIDPIATSPEHPYYRKAIQLRRELDHL